MTEPILLENLGMIFLKDTHKQKCRWGIYLCQCGAQFKARVHDIESGKTHSCGCYNIAAAKARSITHGYSNHALYHTWKNMMRRLTNPKDKSFKNYGGRGITICEDWKNISIFIVWALNHGWGEGLELDRIDFDGNYEPSNCRFTTSAVNNRNTRVLRSNNNSGYRGVSWYNRNKRWRAVIGVNNKQIYIGLYTVKEEAAAAYNNYVINNNLEHSINVI